MACLGMLKTSLRCLTGQWSECRTARVASFEMKRGLTAAYVYVIMITTLYQLFIVYDILNEFRVQEYQWRK
jgi:hypothetical protein